MKRKILVVVDMQNDFISGALGTKEAESIVKNVQTLMDEYANEDIYATKDTHTKDYLNTQEGKFLPVEHCIKGSYGWQFDERLKRLCEVRVLEKPVFGSLELVRVLQERAKEGPLSVTFAGVCTDICVVSNAILIKNNLPECEVFVKADACAGVSVETHNAALTTMKMCQIQVV